MTSGSSTFQCWLWTVFLSDSQSPPQTQAAALCSPQVAVWPVRSQQTLSPALPVRPVVYPNFITGVSIKTFYFPLAWHYCLTVLTSTARHWSFLHRGQRLLCLAWRRRWLLPRAAYERQLLSVEDTVSSSNARNSQWSTSLGTEKAICCYHPARLSASHMLFVIVDTTFSLSLLRLEQIFTHAFVTLYIVFLQNVTRLGCFFFVMSEKTCFVTLPIILNIYDVNGWYSLTA